MQLPNESASIYQQEAAEQLSLVEEIIMELEAAPGDREMLNRLFRVFHTIKGSGSMFGFEEIARFTHHIESILDELRQGSLAFDRSLADLTLAAKDCIMEMLSDPSKKAPSAIADRFAALASRLNLQAPPPTATSAHSHVLNKAASPHAQAPSKGTRYEIRLKLAADTFTRGLDPLALFKDLRELGPCSIRALDDYVPPLDELGPESCYFAWEIRLESACDLNAVKDVFIFVEDDSQITIRQTPIEGLSTTSTTSSAGHQTDTHQPDLLTGHNTREGVPLAPPSSQVEQSKALPAARSSIGDPSVKVPSSRLDQLVSLVGELVINHSRLQQLGKRHELPELVSAVEDLERLVASLRDRVLGIRMTPIGSTFGRFKRLVRDLSAELGREVELVTAGEETELDKNMLDQLGEPLVHLIRNAIDHGIKPPSERISQGKPGQGTLRLSATHEGAHVIIRIEDDGQGLPLKDIRARAIERGLLAPDATVTDQELFQLIFLPGFSTAKSVTSVSGRGVGMDVVKRQIEALRGSVTITSQAGLGTAVILTLPLTLAIIDGLLVDVGRDSYIIPLSVVDENVEITGDECATGNGRTLISVRGELIPFARLRQVFDSDGTAPEVERVVIVRAHGQRMGLVVDRILGTHQTVVQSLGRFYRDATHVSGATILGDGQVALILDVAGLVRTIETSKQRSQPSS